MLVHLDTGFLWKGKKEELGKEGGGGRGMQLEPKFYIVNSSRHIKVHFNYLSVMNMSNLLLIGKLF